MSDGNLDQLERLNRLREAGALTDGEFEHQKQAILAGGTRPAFQRLLPLIGAGVVAAIGAAMLVFFNAQGARTVSIPTPAILPANVSSAEPLAPITPSVAVSPDAAPPESPNSRLNFATSEEVIGMNPAYLEQKLGVPKEKGTGYLVFVVGGCTISYSASGSRITSYNVDVRPACSPTIRGNRVSTGTTFGEILNRDSWGQFTADCIYMCGNAADPVINLSYRGSRSTNFISIRYSTSYDQASDAIDLWEQGVRRELGLSEYESPSDYDPFNCVSSPPADARRLMPKMKVRSIWVSSEKLGPCG